MMMLAFIDDDLKAVASRLCPAVPPVDAEVTLTQRGQRITGIVRKTEWLFGAGSAPDVFIYLSHVERVAPSE